MSKSSLRKDYLELDLAELLNEVLRHIALIILVGVIFGILSFLYSAFVATPLYSASARMIVNSGERYDYVTKDQLDSATTLVETYSVIITGDTVMDDVISNLGMEDTYASTVKSISVKSVNETQIMEIKVIATSPEIAMDVCKEITNVAPDVIIEAVEAGSVKLISKASTTWKQVSPNVKKNTFLAVFFGVFFAAAAVVLLTILDNKVKGENDLSQADLSLLGVIPFYELEGGQKNKKKQHGERELRLIDKSAPFNFVEAYKSLRTNVDFLASTHNRHSTLITSAGPWDGKSTVAINLTTAMANSGKKVILVDCDMRKGSIGTYLKISRKVSGITSVLMKKKQLEEVIHHNDELGFDVLTVGALPTNPSEIVGSNGMMSIIQELSEKYDHVFIDTPPVSVVTDAAILSRFVDGVILVVRADETTKQALALSKKNLEDVNANILGAVLNDFDVKRHSYYGSGYYYSYSYKYGSYGDDKKNKSQKHFGSKDK